jgi:hypothetical protein
LPANLSDRANISANSDNLRGASNALAETAT